MLATHRSQTDFFEAPAQPHARRKRKKKNRRSLNRVLYEGLIVFCLLMSCTAGVILFGSTRMWVFGPMMTFSFLGIMLFWIQPFWNKEIKEIHVPPGGILFLLFFLYGAIQIILSSSPHEARIECLQVGSYVGAYWAWTALWYLSPTFQERVQGMMPSSLDASAAGWPTGKILAT